MIPLLPIEKFSPITDVIAGKSIYLVPGIGNAGDALIYAGTKCFLSKIGCTLVSKIEDCQIAAWDGGGNLGRFYGNNADKRRELYEAAKKFDKQVVILPQSCMKDDENLPPNTVVFAREKRTRDMIKGSILAPDMSFAFDLPFHNHPPKYNIGIFVRKDYESVKSPYDRISVGDPVQICKTYSEYFSLASKYEQILTNRLHFAIVSLMLGRETTIIPNSYHKNEAMYESWLKDLGCKWKDAGSRWEVL